MPTINEQLILHEGLRLKPYVDTVGKVTIGIGHNLTDKGITYERAIQIFEDDLQECLLDLQTFVWWDILDEIRKKVIIDMRFNLGAAGLRTFKNTLKAVSEGKYELASELMMKSKWAKQVKGRAVRLSNMMKTGKDYIT